jgi:xanthine dehydrogenase YagS FAD-binding subunit
LAVALVALHAGVETARKGSPVRQIAARDLLRLPGDTPQTEHVLAPGELITAIVLPPPRGPGQVYVKVRDRASFAFALVSVAAVVDAQDAKATRYVLGGVAHKPWPLDGLGDAGSDEAFAAAVGRGLAEARGRGRNEFKIELAHRALLRARQETRLAAAGGTHGR